MKQDYENMTFLQAIWIGCQRGVKNYFALGGVLWKLLRQRDNNKR
ncbi:hypothetical protein [Burkholderia ubonensis]|nr:hypothetical protein [Burkholderia ubonensis]